MESEGPRCFLKVALLCSVAERFHKFDLKGFVLRVLRQSAQLGSVESPKFFWGDVVACDFFSFGMGSVNLESLSLDHCMNGKMLLQSEVITPKRRNTDPNPTRNLWYGIFAYI